MSIFQQQFGLGATAAATSAPDQTIKRWLHEGKLVGASKIEGGGGRGHRRFFQFNGVIEIGFAKAILDRSPSNPSATAAAFEAAREFAHEGSWDLGPKREPGLPFWGDGVRTLICISEGAPTVIVPCDLERDFYSVVWPSLGRPDGMLIIDASKVWDRIIRALGAKPSDLMRPPPGLVGS